MSAAVANLPVNFPALSEMGVVRFYEISHYMLRQTGQSKDELKIYYKREKGSFLPVSRKYRFGRSLKTVVADSGTGRMQDIYEISPFLLRAVAELDSLVLSKKAASAGNAIINQKAQLLVELNDLDRLVAKQLSANADSTISANTSESAVVSKFDQLRQQIQAL